MKQHLDGDSKTHLERVYCIADSDLNKSAILDIESKLIGYFDADKKYKLLNNNSGSVNQQYYNKQYYIEKVPEIWKKLIDKGLAKRELFELENSDLFKYSPYKSLSEDQFAISQMILRDCMKETESISFVEGNPGTGKTILAMYLLKILVAAKEKQGKRVALVVPMTSLRKTLKKVCSKAKGLSSKHIIGPYDINRNPETGDISDGTIYDVLIVDEAHRLNKYGPISNRGSFITKSQELGFDYEEDSQLDWIDAYSNHQVYFYDEGQSVRPADVSPETFHELTTNKQSISTRYELITQHRTKGGNDFISWINRILYDPKNALLPVLEDYTVRIFDDFKSFNELYENMKNNNITRMVSGYSFPWVSKNDKSKYDIIIDGIKKQWNSKNIAWVNSENALSEVGSIHTVQGYDLNNTFLIFGYDIDFNPSSETIVINRDRYYDTNGKNTTNDFELKSYILNIYNTLMSRGIDGLYIYACNKNFREYLKSNIERE